MKRIPNEKLVAAWKRLQCRVGWLWLAACLIAAWLHGNPNTQVAGNQKRDDVVQAASKYVPLAHHSSTIVDQRPASLCLAPENSVRTAIAPRTKPIEQIQIGDRVAAYNPELSAEEHQSPEPDWIGWKKLMLTANTNGIRHDIELLRSAGWLKEVGASVGQEIHLIVNEIGLDGPALVQSIQPCPEIRKGTGRVVTGTFKHAANDICDLWVAGLAEPIGATENHPFWVENRKAFVAVTDLRVGDKFLSRSGITHVLCSLEMRNGQETVYNLEVELEHCFQVSELGIINHNQRGCGASGGAEHKKGGRPSTVGKHEKGKARKQADRGGEKGDANRDWPRKRPKGHKGPWPPVD